jgi:hypothetical protein
VARFAGKSRGYESAHNFERQFRSGHARAQAENVTVIVFAGLSSRVSVAAKGRTYTAQFVCSYRSSNATAADKNSNVSLAALN